MNALPVLAQSDVDQAASLIQAVYTPGLPSEQQRTFQQQLFEIQKRPEAWGLILPFLEHSDPNVQFFGAHTAQVKIIRDWSTFPAENTTNLRDLILDITARFVSSHRNKPASRKLFIAITSIALKLVPGKPSKWPDWVLSVVTFMSERNVSPEYILEFLTIVAEEVSTSDLTTQNKVHMQQTLIDSVPVIMKTVEASLSRSNVSASEIQITFKCLEAWVPTFPANDLTPLIPTLISALDSEQTFIGASDVLQEILTKSSFADGAASKTLTDPLLAYLNNGGAAIIQQALNNSMVDDVAHSLCKLLVALGEHSNSYFVLHITEPLVQNFFRLMLLYTGLPGYYGVDEEESEMTQSFWYLLQEALWSVDFGEEVPNATGEQWAVAKALYVEVIKVLQRKVTWPPAKELASWSKDQREKFQIYRRDVGDTLINAYYILRDDMLSSQVNELSQILLNRPANKGWEEAEAILHCIMSVQEAVPLDDQPHLVRLFGPEILGRLPTTGRERVRRTALALIGSYANWFTTQIDPRLLLGVLDYVVQALNETSLCFHAANALRNLCDVNRTALSGHILAFGELHARVPHLPVTEATKVTQSIASVIQALPIADQVQPIEAIVSPVVSHLRAAINSSSQNPENAMNAAVQQIQTITACAKGMTRSTDALFALDEPPPLVEELEQLETARQTAQIVQLRQSILDCVKDMMMLWSGDATAADALSDLFKSITALPSDMSLLSLDPGPLLQLACSALQRDMNAVWLTLISMLIVQLDPPSLFTLTSTPSTESETLVASMLPVLLQSSLNALAQENMMESNPDVVQAFFACMSAVARHFVRAFYVLPSAALEALVECAVKALALQERYSLVSSCTFLISLINRSMAKESLAPQITSLVRSHGENILRGVLSGFAGIAPASTTPNLVELLSAMSLKFFPEVKTWMPDILFAADFVPSKADTAAKEKFVKAVLSARTMKKTREAAQEFTLVAKGLEGSGFGYASVTM